MKNASELKLIYEADYKLTRRFDFLLELKAVPVKRIGVGSLDFWSRSHSSFLHNYELSESKSKETNRMFIYLHLLKLDGMYITQ